MPIAKQTLKYFFGATNTDTSKKGVRIGDLVEASNVRQLNAGEYIQRGGLLADVNQTYDQPRGSLQPASIVSPDGATVITRTTDGRAYSSTDGENHRFLGQVPGILADVVVRSPAGASGENHAPLAKRAGKYSVSFASHGYFEVTKSDENGGGIIERHRISMIAGNLAVSSECRSLAVISSDDFDSNYLWIFWTDWAAGPVHNPGAVFARRVPYYDLANGGDAYVAHEFNGSWAIKSFFLTSVSASVVGNNECAVAFCGFKVEANDNPVTWWQGNDGNVAQGPVLHGHFYLDKATGQAKSSPAPVDATTEDDRILVSSGCCILTAKGVHEHTSGHWYYAHWSAIYGDLARATVTVHDVTGSDLTYSSSDCNQYVSFALPAGYPLDPPLSGAFFRWHAVGSITGHEVAGGVEMVASIRPYWYHNPAGSTVPVPATPSPDVITTMKIVKASLWWYVPWVARASWLACGYFREPNNTEDLIVTGYSDKDNLLPTYHVRRFVDGSIIAQIAYGQAAHSGGAGSAQDQTTLYLSDIQQPMLYGGAKKHVVLGIMSDNTSQSVDVAELELEQPTTWQAPAVIGREVFAPGPMTTATGAWQAMREAAPLISPGRPECFYWDNNNAIPIEDGTVAVAVVYRFVYSNGAESKIARSAPYILPNALRLTGTSNANDFVKIPTLRHMLGAANPYQADALTLPMADVQIELYLDFGDATLSLWGVYANDATQDFILVYPTSINGQNYDTLTEAISAHEPGEPLYTTGDALENAPPPMARAVCEWRNRIFAAHSNTIAPSQEFAAGLAPSWNETFFSTWLDGTGGITAICPIDYNYLAIFKQDAIGIISGPGPDGLGRGAYVVQTIPTAKGVTNPRSVINGADGCYFQDAATGRLCILTPQLQILECAPGAWHLAAEPISCALHVESERQVWFATEGAKIIVLDYKHKTEACPFGSVYAWDASVIGYPRSMCLVGGVAKFARQGGALASYSPSTGYDADENPVVNKTDIAMALETGEMQVDNLQGEFALSRLAVLGEYVAPHGLSLTVYPSYSATGTTSSVSVTAGPEQFVTRPAGCSRIQSVRARLVSTSSATVNGSRVYGAALKFVGFALEVQPRGRAAWQPASRII